MASTAGKRFVWASEVPQHANLHVELIKQFCEQAGAPITARKLYKAPISFRPIGVICATSNFPPEVTHKDDTGYARRARIWQTTQTFSTKPATLTEVKAEPEIKQRITTGYFNPQLLWLVKGLARTLSAELNPSTELEPRPKFMRELEAESAEGNNHEKFEEFVQTMTLPCERKHAEKIAVFKGAVSKFLGVGRMQVGTIMTASGYNHEGVSIGGSRVVIGFHPDRGASKGDGLKLKALQVCP